MSTKPKIGEYAVWLGWGDHYYCGAVVEVMSKTKTTAVKPHYTPNPVHLLTEHVLYAGTAEAAHRLVEQLDNSAELMKEEMQKARVRHRERSADLFADAMLAARKSGGAS